MGKNEVQFRIDQYAEIERLLEQVRQGEAAAAPQQVEQTLRPQEAPAHRVDIAEEVRRQYRDNLVLRDLSHPDALSRDGRPPVPKVFESPDGQIRNPQGRVTKSLRAGARHQPAQAPLPSWLTQGVTGSLVASSTEQHEARRAELERQPTRGEARQAAAPKSEAPTQPEPSPEPAPESSLATLVAQYAPDAEVVAGEGRSVPVESWSPDRQPTRTHIAYRKK